MRIRAAWCAGAALVCALGSPEAADPAVTDFGLPIGFSVDKMDLTADPRVDFTRYAAGRWQDALQIPPDGVRISAFDLMNRRRDVQVQRLVEEAAKGARTAHPGSPAQQVGDLYASGMNEARLRQLGNAPLQPAFSRIDALPDRAAAAREAARLMAMKNDLVFMGAGIAPGIRDKTRYIVVVGDAPLVMPNADDYLKPESAPLRAAYLTYLTDLMVLAGVDPADARAFANRHLAMETRIAAVRQPLVEHNDPDKRFVAMPYAALRQLTPAFDWDAYLAELRLPVPEEVTAIETRALAERNAIWQAMPLPELKTLLKWEYLRYSLAGLSSDFAQPGLVFTRAFYGQGFELPPRPTQVVETISARLGHPLGRLYVEKHFPPASRRAVEEMVGRVRAEFRTRLEGNTWLTAATRAQALAKLDKVSITVGHPDVWIDYSPVDVRPGDYFGNLERLGEFATRRDLHRFGGPVQEDAFATPRMTLPTVINAAYSPMRNAIEIPAAFLQPPIYDPAGDAATSFCAIGAVIGHELTHGFDSGGRQFDEIGRARNWWVKEDEERFVAQASKLVKQADAYQVLPGLPANGALAVTENLADVGGIAFAYGALQKYLKAHPSQNREIDGLTQQQRCFLTWAQLWADKSREGYLRQVTATDAHPPGGYRAYSASQHEPGFYEAFGIREGDPMWLHPADRVGIW